MADKYRSGHEKPICEEHVWEDDTPPDLKRAGRGFGIEERAEEGANPREKLWKCKICEEATWSEEKPSPHEEPAYDKFGELLEEESDGEESEEDES